MSEPRAYAEGKNEYLNKPSVRDRAESKHAELRKSVTDTMRAFKPVRTRGGELGAITVRFVREGNKHVANDVAVGHTRLTPKDIENLPGLIAQAKYLKSEPNSKPDQGSKFKKKVKRFHYYEIEVRGRKSYLNIARVVDNGRSYDCLYAITDYMRE